MKKDKLKKKRENRKGRKGEREEDDGEEETEKSVAEKSSVMEKKGKSYICIIIYF